MTLTPAQQAQINNAADLAVNGLPYSLSFPAGTNSSEVTKAFDTSLRNAGAQNIQTVNGGTDITTPINSGWSFGDVASAALKTVTNPIGSAVDGAEKITGDNITGWLTENAGNYGLVILGALLAVGALLISQKDNITTVVEQGAKIAAVAA